MNNSPYIDAAPKKQKKARKENSEGGFIGEVFDLVEVFAICAAVIILCFSFVARLTIVEGPSMQHTLEEGDYLVVSDLFFTPKTGDIVVVQNTTLTPNYAKPLVKRVIAIGGQTVDINYETWEVTVNGVALDESYVNYIPTQNMRQSDMFTFPLYIPEGMIFVMGDNRNESADSRSHYIGLVDERCVVGRAVLRVAPVKNFEVFSRYAVE